MQRVRLADAVLLTPLFASTRNPCVVPARLDLQVKSRFGVFFKGFLWSVNFSVLSGGVLSPALARRCVRQRVARGCDAIDHCKNDALLPLDVPLLCERLLMESRRMTFVEVLKKRQWI
jgi:hypothetical protein